MQTKILQLRNSFHEISTYLIIFHTNNTFVREHKILSPSLGPGGQGRGDLSKDATGVSVVSSGLLAPSPG